jgi:hypothetical protein
MEKIVLHIGQPPKCHHLQVARINMLGLGSQRVYTIAMLYHRARDRHRSNPHKRTVRKAGLAFHRVAAMLQSRRIPSAPADAVN